MLLRHDVQFSILNALKWVKKPLGWTNKMLSFKTIPSCFQLKSHVKTYSLPEKPVCVLLTRDLWVEVFDLKCVKMGVKAIEMEK